MKNHTPTKRILVGLLALLLLPVWICGASASDDSLIDEEELNQWMDSYIREHSLDGDYQRFSVGFCYTATGEFWYYDADQWMYSASLYKVPVSMLMAEKEAAGELSQESVVLGMPLQYWESTALTASNNDSGHAMVDYLGGTYLGKCSDMTIRFTDLPEDYFIDDFYQSSYYTARYMTQVMKTLYDGGEEKFPHVIEYLLPAQPDGYLNLSLKGRFELAQKYGAYQEPNGNNNNHIAAIVYTPTPIIVTVMTRNVGGYQDRIAEVGAYLADYSLSLDAKAKEREEARIAQEAAAASTPEMTEAPTQTKPAENQTGTEKQAAQAESTQMPEPAQGEKTGGASWLLPAVLGLAGLTALILILLAVSAQKRRRRAARRAREAIRARAREQEKKAGEKATAGQNGYRPRH